MLKYTIAHSLLMITSVLASGPIHLTRRQKTTVTDPIPATSAQTTTAQSSVASTSPTEATSNPVTSPSSSSPSPSSSSAPLSTSVASISTSAISTTPQTTASTPSSTPVGSSSSLPSTSLSSILETTSASTSTDAQGSLVTVIVTNSASAASSPSPSAMGTSQATSSHSGTIIGLSVAGAVALVSIIAFIIWKLTRKRFSDLDDTDAIKWPELNQTHTAANDELSPVTSNTYSANAVSRNASTFDHAEHLDPYAVPPLPQFNPNQPYRDDPHASSNAGFYDPYRGPIPPTFHDGSVDGHENIPMSTYPTSSQGRSPVPGTAYDMRGPGSPAPGRASPALGPAYDVGGRDSPAPGRTISPGPAAALGLDKRP